MVQQNPNEDVLMKIEELKRERELSLRKLLELEEKLDENQKLKMEIKELKGKLQVMKDLGEDDGAHVKQQKKEMSDDQLNEKTDQSINHSTEL